MLLADLPPGLVYVTIAVLALAETAVLLGVAVPTLTPLLFAGFLASVGSVELPVLIAVATVAAAAGDSLGYREGRRYGARLRTSRLGRRVGDGRWRRADALFARRGGQAVFLGRLVTVVRTLMPRLAGSSGLPYRAFLLWNAPATAVWAASAAGAGYLAGASYTSLAGYFGKAGVAVVVLVAALAGLALAGRAVGRHPEPVRQAVRRLADTPVARHAVRAYGDAVDRLAARYGPRAVLVADVAMAVVVLYALFGAVSVGAVAWAVRFTGVPQVDAPVAAWVAANADDRLRAVAAVVLATLRSSNVLTMVGVAAIWAAYRGGARLTRPVDVLGTVGAVLPLVVLGLLVDASGLTLSPQRAVEPLYPAQNALVAAGLGTLAWFATRHSPSWPRRVAAWTAAAAGVVLVSAARLYLGLSWPSEIVVAVLVGHRVERHPGHGVAYQRAHPRRRPAGRGGRCA
jgi:undecaprenyl-diphosphatase